MREEHEQHVPDRDELHRGAHGAESQLALEVERGAARECDGERHEPERQCETVKRNDDGIHAPSSTRVSPPSESV